MKRLILLMIPFLVWIQNSTLLASPTPLQAETLEISGGFRYDRGFVCDFKFRAETNEDYLVCDTTSGGIHWQLRARAEPKSPQQTLMRLELSKIAIDGKVHVSSRPSLMVLNGTESTIVESGTSAAGDEKEHIRIVIGADR